MSDDASDSQEAEIAAFRGHMQRVEGNRPCPSCGNSEWFLMDGRNLMTTVTLGPAQLRAYTITCSKCGLIQQFSRDVLEGKVVRHEDLPEHLK